MASKEKYEIEVLFITPINVTVKAEDADEAMDLAESEATEIFKENLDKGLLGVSDFYCEAQTP